MVKKVLLTDEEQRKELIAQLTEDLDNRRPIVLAKASELLGRDITVSSLHGKIGGKNNEYTDCVNGKYKNFQDFYSTWLNEFNDRCERNDVKIGEGGSLSDLLTLFSDRDILEYFEMFLERNFIKNYRARVRNKPEESLWKIWFGDQIVHGLFIAPARCFDGTIRTDKSEIRRADYNYWTIGHVLNTGLYDPENDEFYQFTNVNEFLKFLAGVIKRLSKSQYEKEVYKRYVMYLSESADILSEPFLIPEFRYEGLERKCKYRVDFTVLNPYTFHFVGFELSPASTHMSVSSIKDKKQADVNDELKGIWEKEMHKRNEYLQRYGLTLITFTDSDLQDIDGCFEKIKEVMQERADANNSVEVEESRLQNLIENASKKE